MAPLTVEQLPAYEWLATPVWVFDPDLWRVVWANPPALELWNAESIEELAGRAADPSPTARSRVASLRETLATGRVMNDRWTYYPKGEPKPALLRRAAIVLADGRIGILNQAQIEAPQVAPQTLRAVAALDYTPALVQLFRPDGTPLMRNAAAMEAFGPVAEGDGGLRAMFLRPEQAEAALAAALADGSWSGEAEVATRAGPRWHALALRRLLDPVDGGAALLADAQDITAAKRQAESMSALAADLEAARAKAEAAAGLKSQFLAMMSHELRTPLTGVIGMVELLADTGPTPEQARLLGIVRKSADALLAIVNDVLDFSKIEAGQLHLESIPFRPAQLLSEIATPFAAACARKGVGFGLAVPADLPELVGDPLRLRQVLDNLLSNAVKFTAAGRVGVSVEAAPEGAGLRLRFAVSDTGIGLSEAERDRLFQPFVQADASVSRKYGGTGLGLAICRRLVERMGGSIAVESAPGRGSTFRFDLALPRAVATASPAPTVREPPPAAARGARILVAEDNAVSRLLVATVLERLGHEVTAVTDGRAAVAAVADGAFDLVLMDVQMPDMDGIEAARAIRALSLPHRPALVALSADVLPAAAADEPGPLFDAYLAKPIDWSRMAATIADLTGAAPGGVG
ncbi:MAG TPA: ATP-binding protein [Alphaproteobacteria bacterium]|nr:ATP-binding protein [Alphaproteobacteria bacterium]